MIESRPAKKRDRTRDRLLAAAQELMLTRPASTISIKEVARQADVVHATFYNYFDTMENLFENVGMLFAMLHGQMLYRVTEGVEDAAEIVSLSTRQTLRVIAQAPSYGHFLFDAGLPVDKFLSGLRFSLRRDVEAGIRQGRFRVDDIELTVSMVSGSLLGVALDMHRRQLSPAAIEEATARILIMLGVPPGEALHMASRRASFLNPPPPPLSLSVVEAFRLEPA